MCLFFLNVFGKCFIFILNPPNRSNYSEMSARTGTNNNGCDVTGSTLSTQAKQIYGINLPCGVKQLFWSCSCVHVILP